MKEITDYNNLNHLIVGKKQIEEIENELFMFNERFFESQLFTREQVLNYLSEEDLKTYIVFGLSIKDFLDLAESEKHETGHGLYIIDRKNKTIHVYRYPSYPVIVEDQLTYNIDYDKNHLIIKHTSHFRPKIAFINKNEEFEYMESFNIKVCKARLLEGKYRDVPISRSDYITAISMGIHYNPLPSIVQNRTQTMNYVFDILNSTLIKIHYS